MTDRGQEWLSTLVGGHLHWPREVPLSYPLDIGYSVTVPGWMRRAVINRDRHCARRLLPLNAL